MKDMAEVMGRRRSVAPIAMKEPGPDPQELESILNLALRVPDHGKLTPWRLIVFQGEGRERAGDLIAEIYSRDNPDAPSDRMDLERKRLARAPVVVAVVSRAAPHVKIPEWEQVLSAGALCMNLTLAANAHGFSTNWTTQWYAYDRRFLNAIGLAEHEKIAGFIHIGRTASPPEDRPRPDLAAIATRFERG